MYDIVTAEEIAMATSSLYKDFVITTREEAKGLVDMLDSFDKHNELQKEPHTPFYEPTNEEMKMLIHTWQENRHA